MAIAHQLSPFIFLALLIATLVFILWRGETAERTCVGIIAVGSVLSAIVTQDRMFQRAETGIFFVDVTVLLAFMAIMRFSNRFWPLWITALQIVAVVTHIARFLQPQTVPIAYAIAEEFWVLPMQAILAIVVLRRFPRKTNPALTKSSN